MRECRQIIFKKNGSSEWKEVGGWRNLNEFNHDFLDWVIRYEYPNVVVENWEQALDLLNSIGSSAEDGIYKLLPVVNENGKEYNLSNLESFKKCALYNSRGVLEGIFNLFELNEFMGGNAEDYFDFSSWDDAKKLCKSEKYRLVPLDC